MPEDDILDRAIVARIPVLVKAETPGASGQRMVSVESSTEEVDADGDVVKQEALLGSAATFIATGHLDIDHLSEFGQRLGIPDPSSYIVGRPIEVNSMPYRRTFVKGEIRRSLDGIDDPVRHRYDEFWASLRSDPPVQWFASIYGFPTDLDDCTKGECGSTGATRFVIKSMDWRSLAFTRSPKNTALKSAAKIVTAKAFLNGLIAAKAAEPPSPLHDGPLRGPPISSILAVPQTMDDVYAKADCPGCRAQDFPSVVGYRNHFTKCLGMEPGAADLAAHAVMYKRHLMGMLKPRAA